MKVAYTITLPNNIRFTQLPAGVSQGAEFESEERRPQGKACYSLCNLPKGTVGGFGGDRHMFQYGKNNIPSKEDWRKNRK